MKETDLYEPVKTLFTSLGFTVHAEVHDMDVMATKDDQMTVIELKTTFNLKLILQAIERQKMTEHVYIAIPRPHNFSLRNRSFSDKIGLLRRLELGLVLVSLEVKKPYAQIVFEPAPFSRAKSTASVGSKKRKARALKEISERHGDYNVGGTRGKLVTAYREKALMTVALLKIHGEMKLIDIKAATGNDKVSGILTNNHYGWFARVKPGYYTLTESGQQAFETYSALITQLS